MSISKAVVKQLEGITFAGKTDSGHWIMMDGPEDFGGSDAAIRPKELLLLGLGGCTASDVASILKKKRIALSSFDVNIEAEMTEEHPKVYSKITLEYVFKGKGIKPSDVERAIDLSLTKYCGVTAMFEKSMEIIHTYKIVED
ncbi:MAG: OsmC family protein [Melioribacteraceae bacterium]|nr:OsmC family protein [Melioribacteraceae bacterium]